MDCVQPRVLVRAWNCIGSLAAAVWVWMQSGSMSGGMTLAHLRVFVGGVNS